MDTPLKHKDVTEKIIGAFYKVYNTLGYGFLEKVYVAAMLIELPEQGLLATDKMSIPVFYAGQRIGEYHADLVVANSVIVETKAARTLASEHEAQLLNYLRATPFEVGLLLNFGPKPEFKRLAFDNNRKGKMTWQP